MRRNLLHSWGIYPKEAWGIVRAAASAPKAAASTFDCAVSLCMFLGVVFTLCVFVLPAARLFDEVVQRLVNADSENAAVQRLPHPFWRVAVLQPRGDQLVPFTPLAIHEVVDLAESRNPLCLKRSI